MRKTLRRTILLIGVLMAFVFEGCEKDKGSSEITVTDVDGNVYHGITIGTQVWLKENLAVKHFRNGDLIPTTSPANLDITSQNSPVYQLAVGGSEANAVTYGRLYTWHAATDARGICPEGWHIPSLEEWNTLLLYLGDDAGAKMKETGTMHWYSTSEEVTNSSGFTALPGDYRKQDGTYPGTPGFTAAFWSSTTTSSAGSAWYIDIDYSFTSVQVPGAYKNHGLSVRCIKD
jgi:uncharacterized protein (TIGR02145 family)